MNLKLLKQLKANNVGVAQPHAEREALRVGAFITVTPFFSERIDLICQKSAAAIKLLSSIKAQHQQLD